VRKLIIILAASAAVSLSASGQSLKATPASLSFTYTQGSTTLPAALTVNVAPASGAALNFTAALTFNGAVGPWASVTPTSGKTNLSVKVTPNPATLPVGTHTATLVLTPAGGTALNVPVTLSVKAPPATLTATPNPVTLSWTRGAANPSPIALSLSSGGALMSYSMTVSGATWLTATPKSGIIFPAFPAQVALQIDPAGLNPGSYKASVKIDAPSAANKTQTVEVNLTVNPGAPTLTSLFPSGVSVGAGATTVTLTGTNFYAGTTVTAGATTLAATLLGPTALQATVPASLLGTAGNIPVTVSNPNPGGGTSSAQSFAVYPPGPRITAITNGASFQGSSVAPGEYVSVFGTALGPDSIITFQQPASGQPIADTLAGVKVTFGTTSAPLVFVSSTHIAALVPQNVSGPAVNVTVEYNSASSQAFAVQVDQSVPGIFALGSSGAGAAAAFNLNEATGDLTLNTETNMAAKGSTVYLFATGLGTTNLALADGALTTEGSDITTPAAALEVGGVAATLDYIGTSGFVNGIALLKFKVPAATAAGRAVPVVLTANGIQSQSGVTISVK
jgi:uncharacterized protein (TIGR03437 family)